MNLRPAARSLAAPLLILLASAPAFAQVLRNPSFETAGESADRAAGWGRWGHWINREEGWKPTRSGSCLLGYHHWEIPEAKDSGVYQDVAGAKPETGYEFALFVNLDKAKPGTLDAQTIELRLEASVESRHQTLASKLYRVADLKPNQWEKLTVRGRSPNDSLRVLVIVTPAATDGSRGGALRFDDASLSVSP